MHNEKIKVLVVGAGAVGAYFGARLSQGGADVTVICRSDYDAVSSEGYTFSSPDGDFTFRPKVFRDISESAETFDYVLVAFKALPENKIAEIIKDAVSPGTAIVLIQNGIDIEADTVAAFPDNELISALAYIGVLRTGPGKIKHQSGGRLKIGVCPAGKSRKAEILSSIFEKAGTECGVYEDIQSQRWHKVIWNASFNPVSALTRADTKQILENEESKQLILRLMAELIQVAEAHGYPQPEDTVENFLKYSSAATAYKTSMLLDCENGRPMEVEAIVGNAVRAAEAKNISLPALKSVYALIKLLNTTIKKGS